MPEEKLDPVHEQSRVVRLIAAPGTGKSTCIGKRVIWLLSQGVNPNVIYALSFTRAAANELKERIQKQCCANGFGNQAEDIWVSTAHSLALRMLRLANLLGAFPTSPRVLDDWEVTNIFEAEFAHTANISPSRSGVVRKAYEAAWNTLDTAPLQKITQKEQQDFEAFLKTAKIAYSCLLPGELVKECLDNISVGLINPIALTEAEHLLVDEFQDLNECDQQFIRQFYNGGAHLFVAGDDDQSIYSFRHAAPQGIITLHKQYPETSTHILPDCFRCTPNVLNPSMSLVSNNYPNRISKDVTSIYAKQQPPVQGMFRCWEFPNGNVESTAITSSCKLLIDEGVSAGRILILVADPGTQSPLIEKKLEEAGVPFEGARRQALKDQDGGRAIYAILRLLIDDDDYLAYRTLLGMRPSAGIATCYSIRDTARDNNLNYKALFTDLLPVGVFSGSQPMHIQAVASARETIRTWEPSDTIASRNNDISNLIDNLFGNIQQSAQTMWTSEIVNKLPADATLEEVHQYLSADNEASQWQILEAIYERLGLDFEGSPETDRVRIMTYHGSKGLDADVVFCPGIEVGIMPNRKALASPGLLEEQRRVLYVGLTRARVACFPSFARRRSGQQAQRLAGKWSVNQAPSLFIKEFGIVVTPGANGLTSVEAEDIASDIKAL